MCASDTSSGNPNTLNRTTNSTQGPLPPTKQDGNRLQQTHQSHSTGSDINASRSGYRRQFSDSAGNAGGREQGRTDQRQQQQQQARRLSGTENAVGGGGAAAPSAEEREALVLLKG